MTEKFYKIPQELVSRKDLQSSDKIVFAVLANYQGDKESCWPGIQRLINDTGLVRQTVISSLKRLESAGYLTVKRQGRGKSNLYKTSLYSRPVQPVQKIDHSSPETRPV